MEYFKIRYTCLTVRVVASEGVRRVRGWEETAGVDDAPSECALDTYPCDVTVSNEGEGQQFEEQLEWIRQRALEEVNQ